jgi:hypothetical protein
VEQWASRRPQRPPPPRCPASGNWLCFAQGVSDWNGGIIEEWNSGVSRPPARLNWVRFAQLHPCPTWLRRELGLFGAFAPRPPGPSHPAPAANWLCFTELALFCRGQVRGRYTITPFPIRSCPPLGPSRNWVCLAHLPLVRPRRPVPQILQFAQVWVRFAQSPRAPRPCGLVPPGAAGNWVRFAHFARRGPARSANWLCFVLHTSHLKLPTSPELGTFVQPAPAPGHRLVPDS